MKTLKLLSLVFLLTLLKANAQQLVQLDTILPCSIKLPVLSHYDLVNTRCAYNYADDFVIINQSVHHVNADGVKSVEIDSLKIIFINEKSLNQRFLSTSILKNSTDLVRFTYRIVPYKDHLYLYTGSRILDLKVNFSSGEIKEVASRNIDYIFDHMAITPEGYILLFNNYPVVLQKDSGNLSIWVLGPKLDSITYQDFSYLMTDPYLYTSVDRVWDYNPQRKSILIAEAKTGVVFEAKNGKPLQPTLSYTDQGWKQFQREEVDSIKASNKQRVGSRVDLLKAFPYLNKSDYILYMSRISKKQLMIIRNRPSLNDSCGWFLDVYKRRGRKYYMWQTQQIRCYARDFADSVQVNSDLLFTSFGHSFERLACAGRNSFLYVTLLPESYDMSLLNAGMRMVDYNKMMEKMLLEEESSVRFFIYKKKF